MNISLAPYHHTRLPQRTFAPTSVHLRAILSRAVLPSSLTFPLFLLRSRPTAAHLRAIFFPLRVYRNLSESIRAYQK